jgi:hypothetical protein
MLSWPAGQKFKFEYVKRLGGRKKPDPYRTDPNLAGSVTPDPAAFRQKCQNRDQAELRKKLKAVRAEGEPNERRGFGKGHTGGRQHEGV